MPLSVTSSTVQQTQAAMEQHRESVEPWAKVPRFLIRDASLSALQRLLLIDLLDRRGRGKAYAVVKRATLAADLGVTLSTLDRAIAGLVESGRIEARRSGRAVHYYPAESSELLHQSRQKCYIRVVKSDDSNKQESLEIESKQVSSASERTGEPGEEQKKSAAAARPEGAVKQAEAVASSSAEPGQIRGTRAPSGDLGDPLQTVGDSIEVLDVLMRFPSHLRPDEKPHVTRVIREALERGWAPAALYRAVAERITSPDAKPGLVVTLLRQISQQAPCFSETREGAAATEQATTAAAYAAIKQARVAYIRANTPDNDYDYAYEAAMWAAGIYYDEGPDDLQVLDPRTPPLFLAPCGTDDDDGVISDFSWTIRAEMEKRGLSKWEENEKIAREIAEQNGPKFNRYLESKRVASSDPVAGAAACRAALQGAKV